MTERTHPPAPAGASDNPPSRKETGAREAAVVNPRIDADHRAWVHALPVLRLTPRQFSDLLDYSCSYPTGTTPGKMWRCLHGSFDHLFKRQGGKPRWIVRQYDPNCPPDAKEIDILQFRPVIVLTAVLDRRSGAAA